MCIHIPIDGGRPIQRQTAKNQKQGRATCQNNCAWPLLGPLWLFKGRGRAKEQKQGSHALFLEVTKPFNIRATTATERTMLVYRDWWLCDSDFPFQLSLRLEGPTLWPVCDVPRLCVWKLRRTMEVRLWRQLGRTAVWQRSDMWPVYLNILKMEMKESLDIQTHTTDPAWPKHEQLPNFHPLLNF